MSEAEAAAATLEDRWRRCHACGGDRYRIASDNQSIVCAGCDTFTYISGTALTVWFFELVWPPDGPTFRIARAKATTG
jgi:hypothetical protein